MFRHSSLRPHTYATPASLRCRCRPSSSTQQQMSFRARAPFFSCRAILLRQLPPGMPSRFEMKAPCYACHNICVTAQIVTAICAQGARYAEDRREARCERAQSAQYAAARRVFDVLLLCRCCAPIITRCHAMPHSCWPPVVIIRVIGNGLKCRDCQVHASTPRGIPLLSAIRPTQQSAKEAGGFTPIVAIPDFAGIALLCSGQEELVNCLLRMPCVGPFARSLLVYCRFRNIMSPTAIYISPFIFVVPTE